MLHVKGTAELAAAAAYFGRLDAPTRAAIRTEAKRWAPTLVREAVVNASRHGPVAVRVAQSGKTTVTGKGLVAVFGSTGFLASEGRRVPVARLTGWEFGADREKKTRYISRQRTSGRAMDVYRRTRRQMPPRKANGWFLHPAVAEATPTLVAMWVRAVADVARGGPAGG